MFGEGAMSLITGRYQILANGSGYNKNVILFTSYTVYYKVTIKTVAFTG
jgi:hypothetical protein